MKKENGITLVALVVTIVVLLILAGVSISLVMGQNGVVQKAKDAKTNYTNASDEETEKMKNVTNEIDELLK